MMRRLILSLALVCSLTALARAQQRGTIKIPCGDTGTQAEANACARRDYERSAVELNKVYGQLLAELAAYRGQDQQKLRRAQALWLQYRAANCDSEAGIYAGGSIRPAVYNSCLASVTRERARRLAEFLAMTRE